MRLLVDEYKASVEKHFVILTAWKSDSCRVVKSSTPGQTATCQPQFDILGTWKWDSSRVMRSSDQGYLAFVALLFVFFKAWKCDSSSFLRTSVQGYVITGGPNWTFACPENAIPVQLWDPTLKVIFLLVKTIIVFWRRENAIILVSWNTRPTGI